MSADRPINADVGAPEDEPEPIAAPKEAPEEATGKAESKKSEAKPKPDSSPKKKPQAAKKKAAKEPEETAKGKPAEKDASAKGGASKASAGAAVAKGAAAEKDESKAAPLAARRRGIPGPIKLITALVVIAIAFIVVVIIAGGGGSKKGGGSAAPATSTTARSTPAPTPAESNETEAEGGAAGEESSEDESTAGSAEAAEELGYPSFATSNTTRIGGSDPISNAAATALAVFPSTNEKQRPAAVALVGAEDWAGALAAAVLMAEPIRAPLLYGEAEGVPDVTAAALKELAPSGGASTDGDAVFAIGNVAVPGGTSAAKVAGGDPASEAAGIARLRDRLAGSKPDAILLVSASEPGYAAPAAAYAARSGDPILYTESGALPQPTLAALKRDEGVPVYALGPGSAISGKVLKEVEGLGTKVRRISGADPVATAIAFARFGEGKFGWQISDPGHGFVLTRSDAPLEAAAAAPLSASGTWGPLLLTDAADTLPSELRGYFLDVKPGYTNDPTRAFYNHVWIVGDAGQISVEQQAEVNEVAELAKIGGGE